MKQNKKLIGGDPPSKNDRWQLTYSDMITLLLALFIVLYSMSSVNEKKAAKMADELHAALNNSPKTTQTVNGKGGTGNGTGNGTGTGKGIGTGVNIDALDEIYNDLEKFVEQNKLQDQIGLKSTDSYVQIHLKDLIMFQPNSAQMLPTSQPVMKEIEQAISKVYDKVDHITISGHTADVVVNSTKSDQISWKLSTDRAVTVLNSLIGYGLQQDKLSIQGYAHFDPVASNETEEGKAKNRRVEITVYKYPSKDSANGK